MNREFLLPPSRDLPPNRLAERREHLKSELAPRRADSPSQRVRIVAFVAAAVIVLVGTASAIGGVRDLILDQGFLGLAPEGATPSTPESGELVLHYLGRSASHAKGQSASPLVQLWVYADGRMIWSEESGISSKPPPEGANEFISGYLEQRLTPEGIELMRSQVADLFDGARDAVETLPPDGPLSSPSDDHLELSITDPLGSDLLWGFVRMREDDHLLGLQWSSAGFAPANFHSVTATREQIMDLLRIDALLTDRASVLPPSAWAERKVRAYVPSHYATCLYSPTMDRSQLLSLLPRGAADVLRDKSARRENAFAENCSKLTTQEAREVASALSGFEKGMRGARLVYWLREGEHSPAITPMLFFEPYFPHGQITCSACG
jgi:hypothetical protein